MLLTAANKGGPAQSLQLLVIQADGHSADAVDELQGGNEGVVPQGSPEKPELDGVGIGEIHSGVTETPEALFSMVKDLHGRILIAIPIGPLLHLTVGAAAELEQLLPVLLEEKQDSCNDLLLLGDVVAKGGAVDMDMQAAGLGLMAPVVQLSGLLQNGLPRHGLHVVFEGHRMADHLEAVVQAAVMLAVDALRFCVGDLQQFPGLVVRFSALVQFDLNAHVEGVGAVEDGIRFVAVVVDGVPAPMPPMAIVAEDPIVVFVVGVLFADDPVTLVTGVIVAVVAALTQVSGILVALIVICPHTLAAPAADDRAVLQTVRADQGVIKCPQFLHRVQRMADTALLQVGFHFAHIHTSKIKSARSIDASGFLYG